MFNSKLYHLKLCQIFFIKNGCVPILIYFRYYTLQFFLIKINGAK